MTEKRELLEAMLDRGMVMVTLDARRTGVDVPPGLAENEQLRLNLSYRFGLPLELSSWGVRTTLTFGGVAHDCRLPWYSIYLVASHVTSEQIVFPEDVPQELMQLTVLPREARGEEGEGFDPGGEDDDDSLPMPAPSPKRPRLSLVSSSPEPEEPLSGEAPPETTAPGRSHLRRIK